MFYLTIVILDSSGLKIWNFDEFYNKVQNNNDNKNNYSEMFLGKLQLIILYAFPLRSRINNCARDFYNLCFLLFFTAAN